MCGGMWTHTYLFWRNEKIHHFPPPPLTTTHHQNWSCFFFKKNNCCCCCVCVRLLLNLDKSVPNCEQLSSSSPCLATKRKASILGACAWVKLNCEFNFQLTSHRFLCVSPFPSFSISIFPAPASVSQNMLNWRALSAAAVVCVCVCVCRLRFSYFSIIILGLFLHVRVVVVWCCREEEPPWGVSVAKI